MTLNTAQKPSLNQRKKKSTSMLASSAVANMQAADTSEAATLGPPALEGRRCT